MNSQPTVNWGMIGRILVKGLLLFAAANFLLMLVLPQGWLGKISLYNRLWPGRERLPFGEDMNASYNLSLSDMDAMFASHVIAAPKGGDEFRVVVIGDSSVWGTLLRPEETLPAQLETELQQQLHTDGLTIKVYNLGYPTMSLLKDVMMIDHAMQYEPDLIVWSITLQSFPQDVQSESAIVQQNAILVNALNETYPGLVSDQPALPGKREGNFIQQQRYLADLYRLQLLGFMWGATGIDQVYPEPYEAAKVDFEADASFGQYKGPLLPEDELMFRYLASGKEMAGEVPLIVINEPIMISNGVNSEIRYNYYYARWAYDQYRTFLADYCSDNNLDCVDYWNLLDMDNFTNTAVHYSPQGAGVLAKTLAKDILNLNMIGYK
jgi:hypothetical protein